MDKIINTYQEACMIVPPWFPRNHWPLYEFPFLTFLLQLIVIFCLTQSIHRLLFKPIGVPRLLSQLLAGALLSPTVSPSVHDLLFPPAGEEIRTSMAMLGFAFGLFMMAVKMDFSIFTRTGKKPIVLGLSIQILTGVMNGMVANAYFNYTFDDPTKSFIVHLDLTSAGSLMALTAFPVIGALLNDLNLLHSELGRLALSSGIVSDVSSIAFNMVSKSISTSLQNKSNKKELAIAVAGNIILLIGLVLSVILLRYVLNFMIRETPKGRPVKDRYLILVFGLMLIGGMMTNLTGQFVLLGCFVVGAAIPEGPPLGSGVVDKFDFLVTEVLSPYFISTTAMSANLFDVQLLGLFATGRHCLAISAYGTKVVICVILGFVFKMTFSDSLTLAFIMSAKGFVDMGNFVMFSQLGLIRDESLTYLVWLTTVASLIVPLIIKQLYNPLRKYAGYEKRCIMHSNDGPQLRVLACVCRPDNVPAITNLITISSPSITNNPMIVDVLQLIKLTGRSQPVYVSHNLQQRKSSSRFEDIIWAFNNFRQSYTSKAMAMNFYTIISPPKEMHDDVCTLALDNLSSIIILPFHRKLNIDGHVELDDHTQRALNKSVLDLAPCSVGILVDRGYKNLLSSSFGKGSFLSCVSSDSLTSIEVQNPTLEEEKALKVAVIFIGGKDDQEAVAYAKRIANQSARVTVIRLMGVGSENLLSLLDSSALDGIQQNVVSYLHYMEKWVKDGSETAKYLRSIVDEYDLMIVGRQVGYDKFCIQTSGLEEWSDCPEVGIIGDLLAQPDLKSRTSVLVVQQQKQWTLNH